MLKFIIAFLFAVLSTFKIDAHNDIWIETEQFQDKGGWVRDAQFIDIMGSQYLMAHGLGKIVRDATTTVTLPRVGRYYVWVRTKDWIPQYEGPGKFKIGINSKVLDATFGDNGKKGWLWEAGGAVDIESKNVCITLKDLTGFDGRCDVICLTTKNIAPSNDPNIIARDRAKASRQPLVKNGNFDLLVAGGGVAGICAAVQAARLGLKVALINNRPVLGGNSSSEIKVGMTGNTQISKYPTLGHIARQIDNFDAGTGGATALYKDDLRSDIVRREKNITLFENMNIYDTKVSRSMIKGVYAIDLLSLKINYFEANMFVDCTGDGLLALKSGAECRYGRESFAESGEMSAPMVGDNLVMGSSNQWCSEYCDKKEPFDKKQWMFNFTEEYHFSLGASSWSWESGFANLHTYKEAEEVRDNNLRAIYSHWAYALNNIEGFDHYRLKEVMYMAGKRETYRIVGDMVLTQNDIVNKVNYEDAVVTTSWGIDIHYPDTINSKYFPGEEFVAYAVHPSREKDIYTIPYRCFYSKDIDNLFMAGRNISVTHIALGTVRVQRTTAMMGEMVGIAAWLCKELKTSPRGLYQNHLNELLEKLQ